MIKLLRVDERFVHGQVAFAWTNNLGANCIFVASNEIATNNLRKKNTKNGCSYRDKICGEGYDRGHLCFKWRKIKRNTKYF